MSQSYQDQVRAQRETRKIQLKEMSHDDLIYHIISLEGTQHELLVKAERSEAQLALEAVKLVEKFDHTIVNASDPEYLLLVENK